MLRGAILLGLIAAVAVVAAACSGSGSTGRLLLAGDTSAGSDGSTTAGTDIWAVLPGERPSDATRVAGSVAGPLSINTVNPDGTIARDSLGTLWDGATLLSFRTIANDSRVTSGSPGQRPNTLASSPNQLQSNVMRRGVFIAAGDRCVLARSSEDRETVGDGLCQVSEDERWVVSWPAEGGQLAIRDLRTGAVRKAPGTTVDAVALGHGSRVLAIQRSGDGQRGVVIDATTGRTVGRTAVFREMRAIPVGAASTGFSALAAPVTGTPAVNAGDAADAVRLLWIDVDGRSRTIDRGMFMMPVHTGAEVTYVRVAGARPGGDSIRRWSPSTGERAVLLSGRVGAAAAGADAVVATRDTDRGVELYRSDGRGGLRHVTTLPVDASRGSQVGQVITLGDTAYLDLMAGGLGALARVDLSGDHSDVPVRGWAQLAVDGVDADGTVLVSGVRTAQDRRQRVGVVTPDADGFEARMQVDSNGLNLIHDGVVYVTEQTSGGKLRVRSVLARGQAEPRTIATGFQLAGATWPTDNGGTVSTLISRQALLQAQQPSASGG